MSSIVPIIEYNRGDLSNLGRIFKRAQIDMRDVSDAVKKIIADVKDRGDAALFEYTKKFDKFDLNKGNILLTEEEISNAVNGVPAKILNALRAAKKNIVAYHERRLTKDSFFETDGAETGAIYRPVNRAGIYVPGGKAAYPSTVLMCAVPAAVAGVKEIVMVTPPGEFLNNLTIAAAKECGIEKIYRLGGAQAVAALAYGTESVPKTDIIAGPGNIFVAAAKKEIFGAAGIDMIAGPSEILIIADSSASPEFIAADMLSQAEHDELAMSLLLTTDKTVAEKVNAELENQLKKLPRKSIAESSLKNYGAIIICKCLDDACALSNLIAPEHLELCVAYYENILKNIANAGAVFVGNYSPEPLGDYYAGTNHVLPTSGTARFSSGLGVENYLKRISVIKYSDKALERAADNIILLAEAEGLTAHAESVRIRKGSKGVKQT
jgi:histidinol dehydrogenase